MTFKDLHQILNLCVCFVLKFSSELTLKPNLQHDIVFLWPVQPAGAHYWMFVVVTLPTGSLISPLTVSLVPFVQVIS